MSTDLFLLIKNLLYGLPFNLFDFVFFLLLVIYIWQGIQAGVIASFFTFSGIIVAYFLAFIFYFPISNFLIKKLFFAKGPADATAFIIIYLASWAIFRSTSARVKILLPKDISLKFFDVLGGLFFAFLSFMFLTSFFILLFISLPISRAIKDKITNSYFGRPVIIKTYNVERNVKAVFGGSAENLINFVSIKPVSDGSINLNMKLEKVLFDENKEREMLTLINKERSKSGLPSLILDSELSSLARNYGRYMAEKGLFSHYSSEGLGPFERLEKANIFYGLASQNIAFAPDVIFAMNGLMKSNSNRANILSPEFKKIGIGVVDVDIFGQIFVQKFTD